ncbi:MAG: hypothetical protein FWH42_04815 [Dehalococcoidia bacterium]|nr:hypothetical protein [Dehalococcoidia bacterium]
MCNIPKPEISPNFTIDDIHKIREWNYERRKGMTPEEADDDTRNGAARFAARFAEPVDPAIEAEVNRRLAIARAARTTKEPVKI